MVRQGDPLRLALLVCTVSTVTRNVGCCDVRSASGKISLNRSHLHAVSGDMRRPEDVMIAGIAPQVDQLPAAADVRNCAKRNLRTSYRRCSRVWTQDQGWKRTSAVDFLIIGGKIEIGGKRRLAAPLRYADVKVARRSIATVFPDRIDADPSLDSFQSEDILGWEYERSLDSRVRLSLRIKEAVGE